MQLILYTTTSTNRIPFVSNILLKILLGIDVVITEEKDIYLNSDLPKINYSNSPLADNEIQIPTHQLLFEKNILPQNIEIAKEKKLPIFFKVNIPNADFSFDIFAMTFYLITRYEEYLPYEKDTHGRFSSKNSIAKKGNFLYQPLVNQWSLELGKMLKEKFPTIQLQKPKYQFQSTFDIDYAWAFQHRGIKRTIKGIGGDIYKLRFTNFIKRIETLFFGKKDPYQVFDYLEKIHHQYQVKPIWFFLLADYGKFDQNISHEIIPFQKCIQKIHEKYDTGIHPSMQSNNSFEILQKEKNRLENITNQTVAKSRQHFLKLKFPDTYQNLIQLNIKEDYTLGYADDVGFRASIATPFPWFDLSKNEETDLIIHPFQVMDGTLRQYLNLTPDEALEKVKSMIQITKKVNGTFCLLWHNSTLSKMDMWKDWFDVYEKILQMNEKL